jgi:hypothetical protein
VVREAAFAPQCALLREYAMSLVVVSYIRCCFLAARSRGQISSGHLDPQAALSFKAQIKQDLIAIRRRGAAAHHGSIINYPNDPRDMIASNHDVAAIAYPNNADPEPCPVDPNLIVQLRSRLPCRTSHTSARAASAPPTLSRRTSSSSLGELPNFQIFHHRVRPQMALTNAPLPSHARAHRAPLPFDFGPAHYDRITGEPLYEMPTADSTTVGGSTRTREIQLVTADHWRRARGSFPGDAQPHVEELLSPIQDAPGSDYDRHNGGNGMNNSGGSNVGNASSGLGHAQPPASACSGSAGSGGAGSGSGSAGSGSARSGSAGSGGAGSGSCSAGSGSARCGSAGSGHVEQPESQRSVETQPDSSGPSYDVTRVAADDPMGTWDGNPKPPQLLQGDESAGYVG